jgi:hypothetical protein
MDVSVIRVIRILKIQLLQCPFQVLSPLAAGSSWTDWSHAWGIEMRLRKALEKLNLEYPCDSND